MFLKKYEQLNENEKENIENDILKGSNSFKQLSIKHGCYESAIVAIADSMGIATSNSISTVAKPVVNDEKVITTTGKKSVSGGRHVKHHFLTADEKKQIVLDFKNGVDRKELQKKYNSGSSTIDRIIREAGHASKNEKTEDNNIFKDAIINAVEEIKTAAVKKTADEVIIEPIVDNELDDISNYIAIKTVAVKLDNTINNKAVSFNIYEKLATLKPNGAFEAPIMEFFNKHIYGKGVNNLKVYWKPSDYDAIISAILTKYAAINNCNLSFIMNGIKEVTILDNFCETNKNIQRLSSGLETSKSLYKTKFDKLKELGTIYSIHIITQNDGGNNDKKVIVVDSFDKGLEVLTRSYKSNEDHQYKIIMYKITDGFQSTVISTNTPGFIDR